LELSFLAELLADTTPEGEPSDTVFRLVLLVLPHLTQPATANLAQLYFEIWYLKLAGLYPSHRHCHLCQAALGEDSVVFVEAGRPFFVCGRCPRGSRSVSADVVALLDSICRSHLADVFRLDFPTSDVAELRSVTEFLLQQTFERSFRSLKLIYRQT